MGKLEVFLLVLVIVQLLVIGWLLLRRRQQPQQRSLDLYHLAAQCSEGTGHKLLAVAESIRHQPPEAGDGSNLLVRKLPGIFQAATEEDQRKILYALLRQ